MFLVFVMIDGDDMCLCGRGKVFVPRLFRRRHNCPRHVDFAAACFARRIIE